MTRRLLVSASALALILSACSATTTTEVENTVETSSQAMTEESSSAAMESEDDDEDESEAPDVHMEASVGVEVKNEQPTTTQPRVITISAENWKFSPNAISVQKGEQVRIRLQGISGSHGFAVPDLGINTSIAADKIVEVTLPTDKAGSFKFFCSIPCGSGHRDMTGMITISE